MKFAKIFQNRKSGETSTALESLWKISAHFQPQTAIIFLFYDCLFHSSFHSGWLMFTKSTQMHQKADKTSTSATPSSHKLMFKEDSDSYKDRAGQAVTLFIWAEIIFFTSCVSYYAFPLTCLTLPKSVTLVRLALWVQWNFSQQVAKFLILYNTFLSLNLKNRRLCYAGNRTGIYFQYWKHFFMMKNMSWNNKFPFCTSH